MQEKSACENREIMFYRYAFLKFLEKCTYPSTAPWMAIPYFFQFIMPVYLPDEVRTQHTKIHEHNENISHNLRCHTPIQCLFPVTTNHRKMKWIVISLCCVYEGMWLFVSMGMNMGWKDAQKTSWNNSFSFFSCKCNKKLQKRSLKRMKTDIFWF